MARLALAIAYDGTRFESYARQPGRRTVEGETLRVLESVGVVPSGKETRFRSGSRTDRGVSAAWNVVAFDSDLPPSAATAATERCPEGLHFLSALEVPDSFEPRWATSRTYRYLLDGPWDWKRLRTLAERFRGGHDFSNFRKKDGDRPPHSEITRIRYRASSPGPHLEIEGPRFLWQQVRRIVAALDGVEKGRWTATEVRKTLEDPASRRDFGVAPPENLLLLRVDYEGLRFPVSRVARRRLESELAGLRRRRVVLEAASEAGRVRRSWKR